MGGRAGRKALIRRKFLFQGLLALGIAAAPISTGVGENSAPPQTPAILTVTGAIAYTNGSGRAAFDITGLERLGVTKLVTWTPWTEGEVEFEGILARRLMEAVGASGSEIDAPALNDYEQTIPMDDFYSYDVLLALRMNGDPMRVRDKGPIWIVYPRSDHPELDDFITREKSVWQLTALHVR
jgi:hypothetical protein